MTQPAPERRPTKGPTNEISVRLSVNRRLEAGEELFDRVLFRLEQLERRRRFRRRLLYLLMWILVIAAIVLAVVYRPQFTRLWE